MQPNQQPNQEPNNISEPELATTATTATAVPPEVTLPASNPPAVNNVWSSWIKTINLICLGLCLGILIVVDLPILLKNPALSTFFILMLIAVGFFICCFLFERWAGSKLKDTPTSNMDKVVACLIGVRNFIIVLNVIPFIQLFGIIFSPVAILLAIISTVLIVISLKRAKKSSV